MKTAGAAAAALILILGTIILYSGLQSYLGGEPAEGAAPFATTLLGLSVISFPFTVFFSIAAARAFRRRRSRYELPESPMRLLMLLVASGGFVLLTVLSLTMYLAFFTAG